MPVWARVVVTTAALRVGIALAASIGGLTTASAHTAVPLAVYAWLSLIFAAFGLTLLAINRNDSRASWLGGTLVLLAAPMTSPLVAAGPNAVLGWINYVRPEAFLGAFLWRFAVEFPSPPGEDLRRAGLVVAFAAAALGAVAAAVNLSLLVWPESGWRVLLSVNDDTDSLFWTSVFLPSAAAVILLVIRVLASTGEDRTRSLIFATGLVGGLLPLVLEVLLEDAWPAYEAFAHRPAVEPWLALAIFVPFALIPFVTAYSVVYEHALNVRVVVRAAIQHALARYTIAAATGVPFLALGFYLYSHRSESLTDLVAGARPLLLIGAVLTGVLTLRARRRLLHSIDRRYFREEYDLRQLAADLFGDDLRARTPAVIAAQVGAALERVLHAPADLFVADEHGVALTDPSGRRSPLDARSMLVTLAIGNAQPMEIGLDPGSMFERLPDSERAWLRQGPYALLAALRTGSGDPVGLLALGQKRSELPYSPEDRRALATMLTPLALAIENDRLRRSPEPATDFPAKECLRCSRLLAPEAAMCACGGPLREGLAPHVLRGTFRFDRRIGAGGMGVVYHAVDLGLGREVAMKTLPSTTPEHERRLRREAQAMASIVHPNLAVIYGIETWRGTPFLVEEYLAGGTLAHRLQAGPLSVAAALDLAITLCAVLADLHGSGIVHCDLKPSNIGFSQNGTAKLLDFGLAFLFRDASEIARTTAVDGPAEPADAGSVIITHRGIVGTPPYMCPEAIRGLQPVPGFDLWSLAVVCFEAIAGRRPFLGGNSFEVFQAVEAGRVPDLRALQPACPEPVARFFPRALASDPAARPLDAHALRLELSTLRGSFG